MKENRIRKLNIISLIINYLLFIMTFGSWLYMFFSQNGLLSSSGFESLKYFTVLSNLYLGITSLIVAICRTINIIKNKQDISIHVATLNFTGVIQVTITFLVVLCLLAPRSAQNGNFFEPYMGANLFMHLIVPLVAILNYIFIEHTPKIRGRKLFYTVFPILAYGIFYILNYFNHFTGQDFDGKITYDWYGLILKDTPLYIAKLICLFILGTYLLTIIIYYLNKLADKKIAKLEA